MKTPWLPFAIVFATALGTSAAAAEDFDVLPLAEPVEEMIFVDGATLAAANQNVEPFLWNGEVVDLADWPATMVSWFYDGPPSPQNKRFCTSNLIGPRVALTAAHCVSKKGVASFVTRGTNLVTARCDRHPAYATEIRFDLALCLLDQPVSVAEFETIELSESNAAKVSDEIFLTGFGCHDQQQRRFDWQYRIGRARVSKESTTDSTDLYVAGGAVLCPGDSGGGVIRPVNLSKPEGSRSIIGINSRTALVRGTMTLAGTSLITPTYARKVSDFISGWLTSESVSTDVCIRGAINAGINCR